MDGCLISSSAGTVLGIALLVTFAFSVGAIVQKNHITLGLVILNYALLIDAIGIAVTGSSIWFFTLQERNNYHVRWLEATPSTRILLQDQVRLKVQNIKHSPNTPHSSNAVDTSMELTKPKSVALFVRASPLLLGSRLLSRQTFV